MIKKFFLMAIVGVIICAGVKAEAREVFVGNSPATGHACYVLTDTIDRDEEDRMVIYSVTLKTVNSYGREDFIDYKFFSLDGDTEDVQFTNSEGYKGMVTEYDTPIEWAMFMIVRDY